MKKLKQVKSHPALSRATRDYEYAVNRVADDVAERVTAVFYHQQEDFENASSFVRFHKRLLRRLIRPLKVDNGYHMEALTEHLREVQNLYLWQEDVEVWMVGYSDQVVEPRWSHVNDAVEGASQKTSQRRKRKAMLRMIENDLLEEECFDDEDESMDVSGFDETAVALRKLFDKVCTKSKAVDRYSWPFMKVSPVTLSQSFNLTPFDVGLPEFNDRLRQVGRLACRKLGGTNFVAFFEPTQLDVARAFVSWCKVGVHDGRTEVIDKNAEHGVELYGFKPGLCGGDDECFDEDFGGEGDDPQPTRIMKVKKRSCDCGEDEGCSDCNKLP